MAAESSWQHSIRLRFLAGGVLVAVCAIAATAWLAASTTTGAIRQEQGETAASTALSYNALLGYAGGHATWTGVADTLQGLHRTTGLDLELATTSGARIAASGDGVPADERKLATVVDPLAVDPALQPDAPGDRIDARVIGPFTLPAAEREVVRKRADDEVVCAGKVPATAKIVETAGGRVYVEADPKTRRICDQLGLAVTGGPAADDVLQDPTPTETAALGELNRLLIPCIEGQQDQVKAVLSASGKLVPAAAVSDSAGFTTCLTQARHRQLAPYVAPAALLYVSAPGTPGPTVVGLPAAGALRIVAAAVGVLALTLLVGFFLANRVLRPLGTLADAARRMRGGDRTARADVAAKWEIADVAQAFNDMAEHVERTERQRTELVSDVSHELRTPLGTLRGWLIATQDGLAKPDPALIESLLEETEVLRHLVDDLQDLANADAGELRMSLEDVDAGEVLRQIAAARPDVLVAAVSGALPMRADRVRLRQLIGNLVTNSLRHSPPGEHVVLRGVRAGARVELSVIDRGAGIAAEDLPHVFDRFWRADKSRSRSTGGSGLGLAIVKHLTEAHGGIVTVASTPGAGTTVTVSLRAG
ncbi:ATP-binding protein [Amycolatopsis sp. NPDC005232]|uniref:sensor histidine kinase n=1 Tax=Amycolatopsis sp. NPDC005232 TaxID=3157027 RepID=UPI0033A0E6B7